MGTYLGIANDADFRSHEPVTIEALERFASNPADGPTLEDLHLDIAGGMRSDWNQRVFNLLRQEMCDDMELESGIPWRSDEYIEKLIRERFKRLATAWKSAQPRRMADGTTESVDAVELRMINDRDSSLKSARHLTRRINVSQHFHF